MAQDQPEFPERFGPFTLVRQLGAGGMGSAYLGLHPESDRPLVLKRMHPELMRDETIMKRFVHEAEVAAHVHHGNVAALVAMGTVDAEPFIATEFVFGIQLNRIVDRIEQSLTGPVPLRVGLYLGVELARGLEAIHEARHLETGEPLGLIHRDVGARNCLVGFDGRLRIIDLGLGKSALSDWQTAHQVLAGSPDYMPPEQAMGARVDGRADVYAAAVTIWELIAGRKRIREDNVAARITRAIGAQPEPLLVHRPDASPRLEAILKHAMHPDPDRRTSTARMLRKTLEEELAELGPRVGLPEVVEWLDVACATIIAKERRLVEDALELGRDRHGPVRAKTEFFVGQRDGRLTMPKAYAYYDGPSNASTEVPVTRDSRTLALAAALVDPKSWKKAPRSQKVILIGGLVLVPISVAILTAWLLTPKREDVSPLPADPPALAAERPPPPPPPVIVPPTPPVEEADDDEVEVHEAPIVAPPKPSDPDDRRVSGDVSTRKDNLVTRIRLLRKRKFELSWQRKLTTLGTRLSRARSARELDELEAALRRLEREG